MILPQLALDLGKAPPHVHCQVDGILFTSEAIEALDGAFVHILRNIMDHGIETPADRLAAGKEAQGNIDIYCEERAAGLTVYVADDGRGLAIRKIEELAKERGLIGPNARLDSQHIAQLIFESGFSTRQHLSEISGRGVGMDAVRQFLQSLGGQASIQLLKSEDQLGKDHIPFRLCLHIPAANYRRLMLARAN
jgi:chemotaxis protein histidine kinase CheA